MVQVSASLLAADYARLGAEVTRAERAGVNSFHLDMMDGHYVPNIALAPGHLIALRPYTGLPFQIHLELANPDEVIEYLPSGSAELIIVCMDTLIDARKTFARIHTVGAKVGISLNPSEPIREIRGLLSELDVLLILGVFPGFGGQAMERETIKRVEEAREVCQSGKHPITIAVDGGINLQNALALVKAGADVLVIGTALFHAQEMGEFLANLRKLTER